MSKDFGGETTAHAAELQALDPHYVIPAHIKIDLDTLFEALDTVGLLAGATDPENDPIMGIGDMAALHHSLSTLGKRLMRDVAASFPSVREASQA